MRRCVGVGEEESPRGSSCPHVERDGHMAGRANSSRSKFKWDGVR